MKIGIDKMAFATTDEYIDLRELARERGMSLISTRLELVRIGRQLFHQLKILLL